MKPEEKYNLIEKHLEGTLTPEEAATLQQALANDPGLAEEVELHRKMSITFAGEKIHQFRAAVKEVDSNWKASEGTHTATVRKINVRRIVSIAAAVLLLVTAFWFLRPAPVTNESLFASNFEPYTMVLNQRSGGNQDTEEQLVNQAVASYNQQDFATASRQFAQLLAFAPENATYQFYLGVCQLASGDASNSIQTLQPLLSNTSLLLNEQARWYLGLAYLKNGQVEEAKEILEAIQEGQYRYEEAREVLDGLE